MKSAAVVLYRLDLRIKDHPALYEAAHSGLPIIPLYIWDTEASWHSKEGSYSSWWLSQSLRTLADKLKEKGLDLVIKVGSAAEVLENLHRQHPFSDIYYNRVYHPGEDALVRHWCENHGVEGHAFNGSLLVEPGSITTKSGGYFKVFTPFWKTALKDLDVPGLLPIPKKIESYSKKIATDKIPVSEHDGLSRYWKPGYEGGKKQLDIFLKDRLEGYAEARDIPSVDGTSLISPHLHFGEISIYEIYHQLMQYPQQDYEKYLSELGWREFSYNLLYHFAKLPSEPFDMRFKKFPWKRKAAYLEAWQNGETGYPIVDAGMRQLNETGWMHNRVRMIVASFLTKHLLLPWQDGAEWFLQKLVDADLANNSASWQWTAGCGADAAPYYRIFNPILQGEKFDLKGDYVRRWVPEVREVPDKYIHKPWEIDPDSFRPIVDHQEARSRALEAFESLK